jgi:CubicO group peptidase (beta-lactamase class C family)
LLPPTALLAILLALAACGQAELPAPGPLATIDIAGITLVPYTDEHLGISGVVPEGWFEAMPGLFPGVYLSSPPAARPGTVLIQRLEGGTTLDQAAAQWLPLLGIEEAPPRTGSRQTASLGWDLYTYETVDPRLGLRKGAVAAAETDDGVYLVILVTTEEEYAALYQALFLPAVDALTPAADLPSRYPDYLDWPGVAAIEGVGNDTHKTVEFTLDACTRLRVYAIGEGTPEGMNDFGYVQNASTGQVVWQMYYFETESAGYFRNRRTDRVLTLPAGTYRLHFQTDGRHAFDDWGDRPPGHRFWGISLWEDVSAGSGPAVCWQRASTPADLGWSSADLDRLAGTLREKGVAALMVVTGGQIAFEWGNTANNFLAHSMRKSLLSALYGVYVAEGVIDTSRTLEELGTDDLTPLTDTEKQATVADLLKARSGVYIPAAAEVASMREERPNRGSHSPGKHWYYNNWDFNALGTIFDQETGAGAIHQAFKSRIADPIGMQDFAAENLHYAYEYWLSQHPNYWFRISARDLARLGQLYLQQGEWQGVQVIPGTWVEESTRSYSSTGKTGTYGGYGYMWWVATESLGDIKVGSYAASGWGGHTLEVLPHLNTVIVIRFNTDDPGFTENYAGASVDELILKILGARLDS